MQPKAQKKRREQAPTFLFSVQLFTINAAKYATKIVLVIRIGFLYNK